MKGFLYGQTEFNMLQNTIHLNDYIQTAKDNEFTFLSITDSNLYGCYKFYQSCIKNDIKPIIGYELSYTDDDNRDSIILIYALNNEGYKELLKITTYIHTNVKPYGLSFLNDYNINNLAFITVFNDSIIERYSFSKAYLEMEKKLYELNNLPNYYLGYSYTNRLDRLDSNQSIEKYCKNIGIKTLPIHKSCYLKNEDSMCYEALMKIGNKNVELTDFDDYSFDINPIVNDELKSFINSINLNLFKEKLHLPKYPNTKGLASKDYLKALCYKGLEKRLNNNKIIKYYNRLDYELAVINKMGFNDYFLIVWDFILYAKKNNILVGPGRGSAAGSLVAYCLGITDIDPIKYDLLFERFLNPERVSMPDIDTDFPDDKRDEVIKYVQSLYGKKNVCNISAYSTFLFKSSIRDLGRVMKIENSRLDEIIRLVESTNDYDSLLTEFKERPEVYNLLYIVKCLENLPRHISTHAAGIIISGVELDDIIPLQSGLNDLYQSQLEAVDLESIGLLKMDFLGIKNLSIINEVLTKIHMDISQLRNIPMNDYKTFKLLQNADTLGIFQLESDGIRKVLYNLKPENFDDLVAVLALYRPGPMDNINEFIERRHGKKFTYLHPILEPILKNTYGIIVYQEQIMKISEAVAGFSLGEADLLRRAVSKKNEDKLLAIKEKFIIGALKRGFTNDMANQIYDYILKFANYGFNKSHSVAYGMLSYQMTYLKANYFDVFMSKILNNVIGSNTTMMNYIKYAKMNNVLTFKPNINISTTKFEVTKVGLFIPLQAVFSIGISIANQIVEERNKNGLFKDFKDFKARCSFVGANVLEALIYSGAFDIFGSTKKQMIESKESYNDIFARHLEDTIEDKSEYDFNYLKQKELDYLGFNLTYNLFVDYERKLKYFNASNINLNQKYFKCIVSFENIKEITTKKNQKMLVGNITDNSKDLDFVIFPDDYSKIKVDKTSLYLIEGYYDKDNANKYKAIIKYAIKV